MEEIKNLKTEYKNQLERVKKAADEYLDAVIKDENENLIAIKAVQVVKNNWKLENMNFYMMRRLTAQLIKVIELKLQRRGIAEIKRASKVFEKFTELAKYTDNENSNIFHMLTMKFTTTDNAKDAFHNLEMDPLVIG